MVVYDVRVGLSRIYFFVTVVQFRRKRKNKSRGRKSEASSQEEHWNKKVNGRGGGQEIKKEANTV
jgi:hypothetical protein